MTKILFWNVGRKVLHGLACDLAQRSSSDVVILLESASTEKDTLEALQSNVSPDFHCPPCIPSRFQVFCRDASLNLAEFYSSNRVSLRLLTYAGVEATLGLIHLMDKLNYDESNQLVEIALLAQDIRTEEDKQGHDRTILIGDFNMNPFDPAMNLATGMNAMMSSKCVKRVTRTQQGKKYRFFYNPMWSLLGDLTEGPPGTFYHSTTGNGHYGWNMLDQAIFRPSIIPWFKKVEILTMAGGKSLCTKFGRPNKAAVSDHLPILLTLN
jgi:hypothetical protein